MTAVRNGALLHPNVTFGFMLAYGAADYGGKGPWPDKLIQIDAHLPDEYGAEFRRSLAALDSIQLTSSAQGGDSGQLAGGWRCNHPARGN